MVLIGLLDMVSIHSDVYRELIELLRIARLKKRLLQREVAEQFGTNQSYMSKIELCEARLDIVDYFRLAKILEVSNEDILKVIEKHL